MTPSQKNTRGKKMGTSPEPFQPTIERVKERLRQEREVFNQHKAHENRWFVLRLVMGYSSVILLIAIMVVSSYILFNNAAFSNTVVTAAGAALFGDTLALLVSIWKVVFNPDFMTKLSPITQLEESEAAFFETPRIDSSRADMNDLTILSAKYGADNHWMDVGVDLFSCQNFPNNPDKYSGLGLLLSECTSRRCHQALLGVAYS